MPPQQGKYTAADIDQQPQTQGQYTAADIGTSASQPQAPDKPGFFKRLGQSMGVPTSMDELKQMQANEDALPLWQKALPHMPGSAPSKTDSIAQAVLGPVAPVAKNYAQTAYKGIKEGFQEAGEAGQMAGRGEISIPQAAGKTGFAALKGGLSAVPLIGPTIQTAGEDIGTGNYAGGAGGLTGVIGQLAAPEISSKIPPNSLLGRMLLLGKTPEGAYESAMKPSTTIPAATRGRLAQTGLSEGIPVSQAGVEKLSGLIDNVNQKIADTVAADPNRPVSTAPAVQNLQGVRQRFATQVNPRSDLQAIQEAGDEFQQTYGQQMPAEQAQAVKQGTYRALGDKAYGELKGASIESQKALARGLKDELATQFPELNDLNARDSRLLDLQDSLERAVNRIGNHQAVGIGTPIAAAGVRAVTNSNKLAAVAGFMKAVLDNPNVKSRLAIALSQGKIPSPLVVPKIAGYAGALGRLSQPSTLPFLPGSSGSPGASATQGTQ